MCILEQLRARDRHVYMLVYMSADVTPTTDDDDDAVEHDGDDGALPRQRLAQARPQGVPCPGNALLRRATMATWVPCSGNAFFQASGDGDRDDDERGDRRWRG